MAEKILGKDAKKMSVSVKVEFWDSLILIAVYFTSIWVVDTMRKRINIGYQKKC